MSNSSKVRELLKEYKTFQQKEGKWIIERRKEEKIIREIFINLDFSKIDMLVFVSVLKEVENKSDRFECDLSAYNLSDDLVEIVSYGLVFKTRKEEDLFFLNDYVGEENKEEEKHTLSNFNFFSSAMVMCNITKKLLISGEYPEEGKIFKKAFIDELYKVFDV